MFSTSSGCRASGAVHMPVRNGTQVFSDNVRICQASAGTEGQSDCWTRNPCRQAASRSENTQMGSPSNIQSGTSYHVSLPSRNSDNRRRQPGGENQNGSGDQLPAVKKEPLYLRTSRVVRPIATGTQKKDGNLHTAAVCDLLIEFEDGGTSLEQL